MDCSTKQIMHTILLSSININSMRLTNEICVQTNNMATMSGSVLDVITMAHIT